MERDAIRQAFREAIETDRGERLPPLEDSMNLRTDLGLDSVDFVQLIFFIQSEYGVILESKDVQDITLVGQLLDLLEARLAKKSAA
jgi:acyl carrier protein